MNLISKDPSLIVLEPVAGELGSGAKRNSNLPEMCVSSNSSIVKLPLPLKEFAFHMAASCSADAV